MTRPSACEGVVESSMPGRLCVVYDDGDNIKSP
jgi:hypothetical protein